MMKYSEMEINKLKTQKRKKSGRKESFVRLKMVKFYSCRNIQTNKQFDFQY